MTGSNEYPLLAEDELVSRAPSRETKAFEEIVRQFSASLIGFVYGYIGDRAAAEDIVQETFVYAYRAWQRFKPGSSLKNWLFTIARNLVRNEFRWRRRHPEVPVAEFFEQDAVFCPPSHEDEQEEQALRDKLANAIADLPEKFKMPLLLRDVEGLDYETVSRQLGLPLGTVKSRKKPSKTSPDLETSSVVQDARTGVYCPR